MTRAVAEELSEEHKKLIASYIQENQEILTDYLQVFEFSIEKNKQLLRQRQEIPERETNIVLPLREVNPILRTVWVMDQGDHVMILFPEDY
ncbi:hypothetical protein JCM9140_2287 [Halalkalibacter wakoensis JCM 9140]|uniref:Uncharacterized protein n=1 Tax=Halalkalibacter wakoensis JCM 9140 TaxID=1236970 RepID=W4Q3E5_9BACI|nr:DUF960 family protein [Halalkalibacter wakoensis]GAE26248.1 hypothetical protein JCM9140_2287 [Halalkalibacter wakoensis JCM 9140]